MASGHVNRTNRPNTWLHRPSLRREDSPCQPGAVHTWYIASIWACPLFRRSWALSGHSPRHLGPIARLGLSSLALMREPIATVTSFALIIDWDNLLSSCHRAVPKPA